MWILYDTIPNKEIISDRRKGMGFDIILAKFTGANIVIALLTFVIACCFKKREHKVVAAICILVIYYFGRYGGEGDYMVKNLHVEDIWAAEILSWLIIIGSVLLLKAIFKGIKTVNKEYVEPLHKERDDNREKYKKYLISCDKKGKQPLSYKQWKFAYSDKKD